MLSRFLRRCCCIDCPVHPGSCDKQKLLQLISDCPTEFIVRPTSTEARSLYRAEDIEDSDEAYRFRALLDNKIAILYIELYMVDLKLLPVMKCWKQITELKFGDPSSTGVNEWWVLNAKLEGILVDHIMHDEYMMTEILGPNELTEWQELLSSSGVDADKISSSICILESLQARCFAALFQGFVEFTSTAEYEQMLESIRCKHNSVSAIDFECRRFIAEGAFGVVVECVRKFTGNAYAVKVLSKGKIAADGYKAHEEQQVLALCSHPFVVKLAFAYQTPTCVMLAMELASTDLAAEAKRRGGNLPVDSVAFYAAEVTSALCYLHSHRVLHRDVKPSNILLMSDGHAVLGDFGAAVRLPSGVPVADEVELGFHSASTSTRRCLCRLTAVDLAAFNVKEDWARLDRPCPRCGIGAVPGEPWPSRAFTYTGTVDFMAPEMGALADKSRIEPDANSTVDAETAAAGAVAGYSNGVDWWSLGVSLFKLSTGRMPLESLNTNTAAIPVQHGFIDWTAVNADNSGGGGGGDRYIALTRRLYQNVDYTSVARELPVLANFLGSLLQVNEADRLGCDLGVGVGGAEGGGIHSGGVHGSSSAKSCSSSNRTQPGSWSKGRIGGGARASPHFAGAGSDPNGSGAPSMPAVKQHALFADVKWAKLDAKRLPPPLVPSDLPCDRPSVASPTNDRGRSNFSLSSALGFGQAVDPAVTDASLVDILQQHKHGQWLHPPVLSQRSEDYFGQWDFVSSAELKEEMLQVTKNKLTRAHKKAKARRQHKNGRFTDRISMILAEGRTDVEVETGSSDGSGAGGRAHVRVHAASTTLSDTVA